MAAREDGGAGRRGAAAPQAAGRAITLDAPAKLNLGLRVVGRRDDGYHLLESLFVPLDLADELTLSIDSADRIDPTDPVDDRHGVALDIAAGEPGAHAGEVPGDARNLAVRAARAFLDRAPIEVRVQIVLRKRIPAAAGLGGGSSDAGAVLRGLASLWPDALSPDALLEVALGLGADVPFFLDPRPALVSGVGERRRPPGPLPELAFVLANPGRAVSTAEVFRRRADSGASFAPEGELERRLAALRAARWTGEAGAAAWAALLVNDLAPAAEALCPEMRGLREALEGAGALASGQSGSGATVFGVFAGRDAAERARGALSVNDSAWFRVAISPASG